MQYPEQTDFLDDLHDDQFILHAGDWVQYVPPKHPTGLPHVVIAPPLQPDMTHPAFGQGIDKAKLAAFNPATGVQGVPSVAEPKYIKAKIRKEQYNARH